jgi:hypothetical protein
MTLFNSNTATCTITASNNTSYPALGGNSVNSISGIVCSGSVDATDFTVHGKSILSRIEAIEQHLGILRKNVLLETDWDELRTARDKYIEVEENIKEKLKIHAILAK